MAHLNLDFTLPIALLAGAIVAVIVVRQALALGERRAKARTRLLLDRYGAGRPGEVGRNDLDRTSPP